jgi:hypothetical protein
MQYFIVLFCLAATSSLLGPNILHSTLPHNTFTLCSYPSVQNKVSHSRQNNR